MKTKISIIVLLIMSSLSVAAQHHYRLEPQVPDVIYFNKATDTTVIIYAPLRAQTNIHWMIAGQHVFTDSLHLDITNNGNTIVCYSDQTIPIIFTYYLVDAVDIPAITTEPKETGHHITFAETFRPQLSVQHGAFLMFYEKNRYFGWTKQDVMLFNILSDSIHSLFQGRDVIDDLYRTYPGLRTKDTILPSDIQGYINFLRNYYNAPCEEHTPDAKEVAQQAKKYKQTCRELKRSYKQFTKAYTAFEKKGFPFICTEDTVWQRIVVYNFKHMRPTVDSIVLSGLKGNAQLAWSANSLLWAFTSIMQTGKIDNNSVTHGPMKEGLNYSFINLDCLAEYY